jgi:CHAD domain-containing protein
METTRLPWALHDNAGNQWAELDYDDVTVAGGHQDGLRYRQIEIERTGESAGDDAMTAMAKTLQQAGARPDAQPKLAKALGLQAERRDRGSTHAVGPSTAAEVVRLAISGALDRLLDHDYRVRLRPGDPDSHDVHQARVATRRLRSDLKTFRWLLDPIWLTHTEDELRWLGAVLGGVRDADVMEVSLISTGKINSGPGLAELRKKLAAERADAVARLAEALSSSRYLDLLDRLHAASSHPPLTGGSDNAPRPTGAADVMPQAVNKRWRNMKKKVAAIGGSPSDQELHRIRIAAKNLRYACELSQPVIGKPAKKTAKLAEDVQTVLGEYHDASAAIDWLTRAGMNGPAKSGFTAGLLTAEQDRRRRKLANQWRRRWARLSQPARLAWLS